MDKRLLRVGDWIVDQSNYNYEMRATTECIAFAHLFAPVTFGERFLSGFRKETLDGKDVWYRSEGENICSLEQDGERWRVSIHSEHLKIEGSIKFVFQLQHLLTDCQIYWDICDCGEKR